MIFLSFTNPCSTISILRPDYYRRIMYCHFSEEVRTRYIEKFNDRYQAVPVHMDQEDIAKYLALWSGVQQKVKWTEKKVEKMSNRKKAKEKNEGSKKGNLIMALINTVTSHELLHLKLEWCQLGTDRVQLTGKSGQSTDGVDGHFSSLIRQVRHLEVILPLHELTEDDFNLQNPVAS